MKSKPSKQFSSFSISDNIPGDILQQYPGGINDLLNIQKPSDDDPYGLLILKCSEEFYNKYSINITEQSRRIGNATIVYNLNEDLNEDHLRSQMIKGTIDYEKNLYAVFSKLEESYESIINSILKIYQEKKIENKDKINFEDFIFIFASIIRFYSGLDIKLEFGAGFTVFLYFYGNENIYDRLSEFFDYELQLKPFAFTYRKEVKKNKGYEESIGNINDEKESLLTKLIPQDNEFSSADCDINDPAYWPPYYHFNDEKMDKYRRYDKYDEYHVCNNPRVCELCSKYRSIDKLRLINRILHQLIKFSAFHKTGLIISFLLKRNSLIVNKINQVWNIFDSKKCLASINTSRNFFGEEVSFFSLWLDTYTKWCIFPSIIGIILTLMYYTKERVPIIDVFSDRIRMDYYDFCLILFCVIITFSLSLLINIWKQKEKLYSYIWGVEDADDTSQPNEDFKPDTKEELIFGYCIEKEGEVKHILKKYASNLVLLLMIFIVLFIVYWLFSLKETLTNNSKDEWYNLKVGIGIASINGIQIKVMNLIYYYLASYLNNWENHSTIHGRESSLAIKLIMFDFVNSYYSLFYIAFIKPKCQNNNCLKEIETQIYTIFLIYLGCYLAEILLPTILQNFRKKKFYTRVGNQQIEAQSPEHLILCDPLTSMNFEHNNIITQFGYVCLFSVAAPLTPLIALILAFIERFVVQYKLVHLVRVEFIEGRKGIGRYNRIIKLMFFIGIMVNVALVIFSSPNFRNFDVNNFEIRNKLLIYATVENLILIIIYFVSWNILPKWFSYLKTIKELYMTKFVFRENNRKV